MAYAIICDDKSGCSHVRDEHRPAHMAYLDANASKLLAAGAQLSDDGKVMSGGILLVDTDDRAEAEAFIANDPFAKAGLFQSIKVVRWRKGFFGGKRL